MHRTISEVARQVGVNKETIRFYERKGLIEKPERTPAGYRLYTDEVIRRIRFIQSAKTLGFTLNEISELLALQSTSDQGCSGFKQKFEAKIDEMNRQVAVLQSQLRVLTELLGLCQGCSQRSVCSIIQFLESGNKIELLLGQGMKEELSDN